MERVAAVVPIVLGVATIAVVALLAAEIFGAGAGLGAALVLALSPPYVYVTVLGRADHHAMEGLLIAAILLAFVRALRSESAGRRATLAMGAGAVLAISFWVWLGSALFLLLLALLAAGWHVAAPDEEGRRRTAVTLAIAASTAAFFLAFSIRVCGPPDALTSFRVTSISGLSVALCAAEAVGASLLAVLAKHPRGRLGRVAEGLAAAAIVCAVLLAVPAEEQRSPADFAVLWAWARNRTRDTGIFSLVRTWPRPRNPAVRMRRGPAAVTYFGTVMATNSGPLLSFA